MHSATPTLHGWLHICGARAQNFQPGRTSRARWRQSARNERRHNEKSVWSGVIMTTFKLNDRPVSVNVAEDTPLLLQQLGWTEGRNVRIDIRWGQVTPSAI